MLPKDLTFDIIHRLNTVRGQVEGLSKMVNDDRDPEQILVQFKSVQKSLDKAHFLLLDEVYRKALAIKISETSGACPGNCGNEKEIENLRKMFPDIELDNLTSKMTEILELEKRLKNFKDNSEK
jgi:CsoR family transcriptional regulator, copper-sensing transcriptional repressor